MPAAPDAPWSLLASSWEELFPLRPPRLALALELAPEGARTLDAGCGTGLLPRALAARGRVAHGLDLEPAFLAVARAGSTAVTWHQAGLLEMADAVGGATFELVTCLGQTLPHLLEEAEWLAWFSQARRLLNPGGHLVIQVVNDARTGLGRELPALQARAGLLERRRVMVSDTLARFETTFRPAAGAPLVNAVLHRRMTPERASALLRQAGLEPGPALADEAGHPFTETAPGWVLIAGRD